MTQANDDLKNKNHDAALDKYHTILKEAPSSDDKKRALEGMEIIGNVKSLPEIRKYCLKLDPIMWDYKEPDQELVDASVRVYISIANNLFK